MVLLDILEKGIERYYILNKRVKISIDNIRDQIATSHGWER